MIDINEVVEKINHVTREYEKRHTDAIFSTQTKTGRFDRDDIAGLIGRVNAARDLRSALYTALGLNP